MTTTLIARSMLGRARREQIASMSGVTAHAVARVHGASSVAQAPTTATNLWLGGDVQVSGFGSKYATKRITPGRLEGMT
jgi:hypothetical protein